MDSSLFLIWLPVKHCWNGDYTWDYNERRTGNTPDNLSLLLYPWTNKCSGTRNKGSTACQCSPAGLTYEYQCDYSMNMQRKVPRIYNVSWHCKVRKQNTDVNKLHYTCIRKRIKVKSSLLNGHECRA